MLFFIKHGINHDTTIIPKRGKKEDDTNHKGEGYSISVLNVTIKETLKFQESMI